MSAYKVIQTQMKRIEVLTAALESIKPDWKGHIKIDITEKTPLYGFSGDDRSKKSKKNKNYAPHCSVIVPGAGAAHHGSKNVVGASSNDIGFSKNADETFSVHISDFDSRLYGTSWQGQVKAEYGLIEKIESAMKAGAQIGTRQTYNHPKWGQVPGVRGRIKKSMIT